jgi:hypothetical protein
MAAPLTAQQRRLTDKFAEKHGAFVKATADRDRLGRERGEALLAALDAGVFATTLAKQAGLTAGRVYQLRDELKARHEANHSPNPKEPTHA